LWVNRVVAQRVDLNDLVAERATLGYSLRAEQQRPARVNADRLAVLIRDDVVVAETNDIPVAEPRVDGEVLIKLRLERLRLQDLVLEIAFAVNDL
jgi:hypothetical protein